MTKLQKYILVAGVLFILMTEGVKRLSLPEKSSILIGLAELVIAAALGLAFALSTFKTSSDNGE